MQLVPRSLLLTLFALGSGLVAPHASAQSVRMVDESELFVRLWTPSPDGGYVVRVDAVVYGLGSHQDAIRLDVKQGSRTLSSTRCAFDAFDGDAGQLECESEGAPLTATGDVTIDLVFMDDTAETTEVIRTLALRVNAYPYWMRTEGRRQVMGARYQIDGSDQLGTAFAYMSHPSLQQTVPDETQRIVFYSTFSGRPEGNAVVMRCSAGGQRLPDIRADFATFAELEVDEWTQPQAEIRHVGWYRARIAVENLWWGTRLERVDSGYDTTQITFLGDHPGLWSCDLRSEGAVLRTFRFTADAAGRIVPHPEQTGPSALRLVPGTSLIDVRLPTPNPIDVAVDPAAIRRGAQYGRPWGDPGSVREMLDALPPASGSSAPTGGRTSARRGH
jgi:hypothetical protein